MGLGMCVRRYHHPCGSDPEGERVAHHSQAKGFVSGTTILFMVGMVAGSALLISLSVSGVLTGEASRRLVLGSDALVEGVCAIVAFIAAWGRRDPVARWVWLAISAGVAAAAAGDGSWLVAEWGSGQATPGAFTGLPFFALEYVLVAAGALTLAFAYRRDVSPWWPLAEASVTSAAFGAVLWIALFLPPLHRSMGTGTDYLVDLTYVVADIGFLFLPVLLVVLMQIRHRDPLLVRPWALATGGYLLILLADAAWFVERASGSWSPGSLADFGYSAGHVLVAAAALAALDAERFRMRTDSSAEKAAGKRGLLT